jgi:aminoglycoside phosphotransferase (APT) family kinase protein
MSVLAVGGSRLRWDELPGRVSAALTARLGAPVVAAEHKDGGFSPGLAAVLRLADGRSVFVKTVGTERNELTPGMYRREAAVLAALPPDLPAVRLLWTYDDGDWVALATEALDGATPQQPWRADELAVFLATAEELVERLTPSPIAAPTIAEHHDNTLRGFRRLAADPPDGDALDDWTRRHLDRLAALEERWTEAATGSSLLHGDLRADNVVLTPAGAVVVDWPDVSLGAGWVDLLFALPSIAMHGGGDPQELWQAYRPARAADPDAVNAVLTAATGFFVHSGQKPAMPFFPTVRAFQRAQGVAALAWLRRRLGWR